MKKKILFLPHCLRVDYAEKIKPLAVKKGYDVYVLPGSSKMKGVLEGYDLKNVEKIIGVACMEEIPLALGYFGKIGFSLDKVFSEELTMEGCVNTEVNISELEKKL